MSDIADTRQFTHTVELEPLGHVLGLGQSDGPRLVGRQQSNQLGNGLVVVRWRRQRKVVLERRLVTGLASETQRRFIHSFDVELELSEADGDLGQCGVSE